MHSLWYSGVCFFSSSHSLQLLLMGRPQSFYRCRESDGVSETAHDRMLTTNKLCNLSYHRMKPVFTLCGVARLLPQHLLSPSLHLSPLSLMHSLHLLQTLTVLSLQLFQSGGTGRPRAAGNRRSRSGSGFTQRLDILPQRHHLRPGEKHGTKAL